MRSAFAEYDSLSRQEQCEHDRFGGERPARVWCYLTHSVAQLQQLFITGHGLCIISPLYAPIFLEAIQEMGRTARVKNLYIEEVMALAQMWNSKVISDAKSLMALRTLATERSRRVFGFCADFLLDEQVWEDLPTGSGRPATLMGWLVPDRPHKVW